MQLSLSRENYNFRASSKLKQDDNLVSFGIRALDMDLLFEQNI